MLLLQNATFLMIPRTGTTWARQAMRNAGVRYKEWGPKHSTAFPPQDGKSPAAPGFRFTFVRDAETWALSRWTLGPWEDELKSLWVPDPGQFVAAITPAMASMYFAKYTNLCTFIGRTESLVEDLVKALNQCGEKFNERDLRNTPPINESDGRLQPEAFYDMLETQWEGLPPEDLVRMPTGLLPQLPDAAWDKLNPEQFRALAKRLAREAAPPRRGKPATIFLSS